MRIALLGFGEVGQRLAQDLGVIAPARPSVWDVLFRDPQSPPSRALCSSPAVPASNAAEAVAGATHVFSAVTAADSLTVAREVAAALMPNCWYIDLNSVSPSTRQATASVVEAGGGRYVEAAVMSPIAPRGIASPMLLGGRHAECLNGAELGLTAATVYARDVGPASAAKMCRSVLIKGLEALFTESLLTARHYGVETTVLGSLSGILPAADWPAIAHYMISRSVEHGVRRAAEMGEVAATVAEAGVTPWMSQAAQARQDWAATRVPPSSNLTQQLDALLASL